MTKLFARRNAVGRKSPLFSFLAVWVVSCCWTSAPVMAAPTIAYVQGAYATPSTPQSSVTVTFATAQAAGDLNVIAVGWNDSSATVSTVTDKSGNTYTRAVGPTIQSGVASQSIYYAKNIAAAAAGANSVTVIFSSAAVYPDIRIIEYKGADPNNPVDVTAAASGSSATSNSGAVTTTNATDLIFGANLVQTSTSGAGSGFTKRLLTSPDGDIAEDRMVTATGSYSATAPMSTGKWIMQMAAFRTPVGSFTLSSSPSGVTVAQGNQGTSTLTTTVAGGFSSAISLSASGMPAGTTVSFNPSSIAAPGSGTSMMTIAVGLTTVAGTYPITVTGSGGGIQQTTTVTLTVTATVTPSFTLSASPSSVNIAQGNKGTSTLTATVGGGFNSAISLSASGTPTGATVSFNPSPIAAPGSGNSVMTITVGTSTTTGIYPITVTGSGGGIQQSTTVTLTVTQQTSPTAPTNLVVTNAAPAPIVSTVQGYYNSSFLTSHTTATFDSTGGNLIVMCASSHSGVTLTPSDSFGNTWIPIGGPTNASAGTYDLRTQLWYAKNPIVGPGHTITMNLSMPQPLVISVIVVKGASTISPIDAVSLIGSDNGTQTTNIVSPTITTVSANNLLIGFAKVSAGATFISGAGFTQQAAASSNFLDAETGLAPTAGNYSASFTINGQQDWESAVVAAANSPNQTTLSWTASTEVGGTISEYLIERCQGTGCTNFVQIGTATATSFNDTGLAPGSTYSYRVRAQDTANVLGPYSSVVPIVMPALIAPAPTAPANLSAGGPQVIAGQNYVNATPLTSHTTAPFDSTGGDLIVISAWSQMGVTFTPSDNFGNTWIPMAGPSSTTVGSDLRTELWYAKNPIVGPGHTITLGLSAAQPLAASVIVAKGSNVSSPIDAVSLIGSDNGTQSTTIVSPSITTTAINDLLIGFASVSTGGGFLAGSGATQESASSNLLDVEAGPAAAPGVYTATFTSTAGQTWQSAIVAALNTPGQTILSWNPSAEVGGTENGGTIGNYLIERCQGTGCTNFTQIGTATGTTFVDTTLTGSSAYSYRVRAQDTANALGPYSNVTTVAAQGQPPTAPGSLSATAAGASQMNLSWTASTSNIGVADYVVQRCQGAGCTSFVQIGTSTGTTYSDTGLLSTTSYTYRVEAIDVQGNASPFSNTATATTGSSSGPSITYVQGNYATPQTAQTSVTVTFTGAQAAGNLNVVVVGWNDSTATVSSVTDKSGNTYTLAVGPTIQSGVASQSIYYAKNIVSAGASANSVTVTFSAAAVAPDIRILEYKGADLNNPVDVTAASSGSSAISSSGSATTGNPTDLIFGANLVQTSTTGPGSGFTSRLLTSPDGDIAEDEMVTAAGSFSATAPISTGKWIMQMVAFRTPSGSLTLSASPTSVTVLQGNQGTSMLTTSVASGFSSAISLSASGMPAGTTVSFNPSSIPAPGSGTSTMTITVALNTVTGTYPITVIASGGGIQQTTTVTLTVTATVTPSFTLSASPTAVSIVQGNQGTSTLTTIVSGGFNSSVSLSASGMPTGVTASFNPSSIPAPGSGTSTMTITVGSSTATGTYPITITGNGGGIQQTATVTLTVTGPANFTLSASPTSVSVAQGNQGTSTVTTTVNGGFNNSVSLSASGVPTGTTVSFNPSSIVAPGSGTSTMTIAVGASTTTGTYPITVTGSGGTIQQSATVTLTVATTTPTISYVQGNYAVPQTPQASVTVGFTGAQGAGDLNVVAVGWNDSTAAVSTVTDKSGNIYTLAVGPTVQSGVASQSIYYAKNIAAAIAGANSVTVVFSAPAVAPDIRILEYKGADPNNPMDVTAAATGTSATSNSGAATTTNATDLIFGANLVQTTTTGPGSGFTSRLLTSPDSDIAEDRMVTGTASYNATAPLSSGQWIMQMVAFRTPAVCSGAPPTAPSNLIATPASVSQINLNWAASTSCFGIAQYVIQRCQGANCTSFAQVGTATGTTFSDTSAAPNTTYLYQVQAIDNVGNASSFSNVANATTAAISISPRVTPLTFTRTQQFTSAGSANVIWLVDGVAGGASATGTISPTGLYTPPNTTGTHTVTVSTSDLSHSANSTVYIVNYAGTFTRDVDTMRTGLNPNETVLTSANVNAATFGKLYSYPIDGVSDASPLYVANLSIPGQGFHNVAFVATEHDSVYAFDADGLQSAPLWHDSFINPSAGITTVPTADEGGCNPVCDIKPEIGITGSSVIDPTTNTLYVVAKTKEVSGGNTNYVDRLHALDITTGAEKFGGPVVISASVPGNGSGSSGGHLSFDTLRENQRSALLLSGGVVYIAFAAHGDVTPWHGWVLAYNAATLAQTMAVNTSPNDNGSGIWMSGDGLATDASGNLYFVTGNGTFDVNTGGIDYGDSLLRINQTTGAVVQYFTPHDQANMAANDLDLGSGGVTLLPDQAGSTAHPHLALTAGKNGTIYLVDRDTMGGYNPNNDGQIVQSVVNEFPGGTYSTGNFKAPVYWNGNVYYSADADYLKSFTIANAQLSTTPTSEATYIFSYPGATLGLSSNGNTNPILWVIQRVDLDPNGNGTVGPGSLHAFDATNLQNELYNSMQASGGRDMLDYTCKWSAPLVANGKVYVASESLFTIFGLLP